MRSPNVIFSQNPRIRPCRVIPLEQLTKGAYGRKCSKGMELRLGVHPPPRSSQRIRYAVGGRVNNGNYYKSFLGEKNIRL